MRSRPFAEIGPTATQLRARAATALRDEGDASQPVAAKPLVALAQPDAAHGDGVKHPSIVAL